MEKESYRLNVIPALEVSKDIKQFTFNTLAEVVAAQNTLADMLLYLQDDLKVMLDYSNVIGIDHYIDDEWVPID